MLQCFVCSPIPKVSEKKWATGQSFIWKEITSYRIGALIRFFFSFRSAMTLCLVMGIFVVCWLPFFIWMPVTSLFELKTPRHIIYILGQQLLFPALNNWLKPVYGLFGQTDIHRTLDVYQITFKNFSVTCASNGSLIE